MCCYVSAESELPNPATGRGRDRSLGLKQLATRFSCSGLPLREHKVWWMCQITQELGAQYTGIGVPQAWLVTIPLAQICCSEEDIERKRVRACLEEDSMTSSCCCRRSAKTLSAYLPCHVGALRATRHEAFAQNCMITATLYCLMKCCPFSDSQNQTISMAVKPKTLLMMTSRK